MSPTFVFFLTLMAIPLAGILSVLSVYCFFFLSSGCSLVGQALCCRFLSIPVYRFVLGGGSCLASWHWGSTTIELRLFSWSRLLEIKPFLRVQKNSQLLILIAGILPGLALLAGYLTLDRMGAGCTRGCGAGIFHDLALLQLFHTAICLLPQRSSPDANGRRHWRSFLDLLRAKDGELSERGKFYLAQLRSYDPATGDTAVDSPRAETLYRLKMQPGRLSDAAATRSIHANLLTVAGQGDLSAAEEMFVLDTVISDALTYEGLYSLEQLDVWSRRLAELALSNRAAQDTLAAVLVTLGRFEEGKQALEALDPSDEALSEFFRGMRAGQHLGRQADPPRVARHHR